MLNVTAVNESLVLETPLLNSTVHNTTPNWTVGDGCVWDPRTGHNCSWAEQRALSNGSTVDVLSGLLSPEHPQPAEKVYWALMLVILPFLAVFGNILIILSVYKERSLQTATNYFIVSLAFADLLVAAAVMPFAVYVLVSARIMARG
ncbi:unnamed protein product, partial [Ixodes pacificus]